MKYLFFTLFNLFVLNLLCYANIEGWPIIKNFTNIEYEGSSKIFTIACADNGLLYAGYKDGILVFDGENWQKIYCGFPVLSLAKNSSGEIFIASNVGIGKLNLNSADKYVFISFNDLLEQNTNETLKYLYAEVFAVGDKIIFVLDNQVIIYSNKATRILENSNAFTYCQILNNELYLYSPSDGFYRLINNKLNLVNSSVNLKNKDVKAFIYCNEKLLSVINGEGIYNLYGDLLKTENSAELSNKRIKGAIQLSDSSYVLNTNYNGAIVIDNNCTIQKKFHFDGGLASNNVFCSAKDAWNNLWIGTENGISSIRLNFPFSLCNSKQGIGTGYTACRIKEKRYFGTSQGLYQSIENNKGDFYELKYKGKVFSLVPINDCLYFSSDTGIYAFRDEQVVKICSFPDIRQMKKIPYRTNDYLACGSEGFLLLKGEGEILKVSRTVQGFTKDITNFEFVENNLWAKNSREVYRLQLNKELSNVDSFEQVDKIDKTNKIRDFISLNNEIKLIADSGVYSVKGDDFIKDDLFNKVYGKNKYPIKIQVDIYNRLWVFNNGTLKCFKLVNGNLKLVNRWFHYANNSYPIDFENVSCLDEKTVIIGKENGFLACDPEKLNRGVFSSNRITKVSARDSKGNLLELDKVENIKDNTFKLRILTPLPHGNSIKFYFSAGYSKHNSVKYSTFLGGFDNGWSDWSAEAIREFTNLKKGNYKFVVRSINKADEEAYPAICEFEVLPPWYLTSKAKIIGVIVLILKIGLIERLVRLRMKKVRLIIEKEQEERLFREEQKRIEEKLIRQKDNINQRNQQLRAENINKSKELASTNMDIIKKNHFLTELKEDLEKIKKSSLLNQKLANSIKLLIAKINSDINKGENWEVFEDYFDTIHEQYLHRMKDKYPHLTAKDLRLGTYLRMNLPTKEIAPLMNISVRGVEISRYRLRKKLALSRNDNLNEFLMKL